MSPDTRLEECALDAALYSLGALPPDETRAFERRLKSGCPFCTAEASQYAVIAEHLAMAVAPVQPPPALRERLLNRITAAAPSKSAPKATVVRGQDSPWIKVPFPGVEIRPLLGEQTVLVRMQAGAVFPEHEHKRAEQCFVLEGSVTDSDGLVAYAGDFVCMPAGITHAPIHTDTGCVLLITYTN
jgi:anti-sigma factor ChrR (cupin superfamily)